MVKNLEIKLTQCYMSILSQKKPRKNRNLEIDPQTVCPQNQFIVNSSNHFFLCQARQDNQTREGLSKDSERFLVFFFEI